ncbi:sanguinarine reductase isoform X1 [Benincasa hispida]|uniref:sanguinarine reductase isoform X1 n=1 Tax=Benincasa hispida TaxID=102211 RepID=UPI0019022EE6|nr:sanguinarine reductase isoform X1 [Benincasa hispida]
MAAKLSLSFIPHFPLPASDFHKTSQSVPLFGLAPLCSYSSFENQFRKSISSCRLQSPAIRAINQEVVQSPSSEAIRDRKTDPVASSKLVLVVGGSGGVGQLVAAALLDRNVKLRLLLRDPEKATTLFGEQDEDLLQVCKGDTRNPEDLDPSIFEGVTHVICCTGTTAFPSRRWDGDNTPERIEIEVAHLRILISTPTHSQLCLCALSDHGLIIVDWEGVRNLISAVPRSVKRVVLVSSIGVTKFNELPWSIMNLFGVLKYKKQGEDFLRESGLPFTIIRAGRLTDGPYTSYDLNTLLKATAGQRRAVLLGQGDKLIGEASRIVVAEACIQALDIDFTEGQAYEINSVEGEGPGNDPQKWSELFKAAQAQ